jgi:hypothetical protein
MADLMSQAADPFVPGDRIKAGVYSVTPLEKDNRFFGVGRFHNKKLNVSMKWDTFVRHDSESPIQFPEVSDHMQVNNLFWSKMKQFSSERMPFVFNYSITGVEDFKAKTGLSFDDMPCIVRDAISKGLIHCEGKPVSFDGVTTWFMYIGTSGSIFAFHREDMKLFSINFLLAGAPKVWYIVEPKYFEKTLLEAKHDLLAAGQSEVADCDAWEMHKSFIMDPKWFDDHNIPLHMVIQKPGQAVIVHPLAIHFGFNTGLNEAYATNFGTVNWLANASDCAVVSVALLLYTGRIYLFLLSSCSVSVNMVVVVRCPFQSMVSFVSTKRSGSVMTECL